MTKNIVLNNILRFLLLLAIQVLVFNNISFGGYITPLIFAAFVLMLPCNTNRMLILSVAFASGLVLDLFCNMLGFHAFCGTLIAFMRIMFADNILIHNEAVVIDCPSIRSCSWQRYSGYSLILLGTYSLAYFMLEIFSLADFGKILLCTILSTLVTWLLIMLYQMIFIKKEKM